MNKRNLILIFGTFVIVIGALIFIANARKPDPNLTLPAPNAKTATYEGTLACLPPRGDGPHTDECAIGLKTKDGKYYAVDTSATPDTQAFQQPTGTSLKVTGHLTNNASFSGKYNIAGTIATTLPVSTH